jgi:hypothetical protein
VLPHEKEGMPYPKVGMLYPYLGEHYPYLGKHYPYLGEHYLQFGRLYPNAEAPYEDDDGICQESRSHRSFPSVPNPRRRKACRCAGRPSEG